MCGSWMPCTPMSSSRRTKAGSKPGVRTMGVMPTRSAASTMSCTSRKSKLVCSRSMNAASYPAWPMISTICGSAMPPTYVPSASPPSRKMRLTRFGCTAAPLSRRRDRGLGPAVDDHCLVDRRRVHLEDFEVDRVLGQAGGERLLALLHDGLLSRVGRIGVDQGSPSIGRRVPLAPDAVYYAARRAADGARAAREEPTEEPSHQTARMEP